MSWVGQLEAGESLRWEAKPAPRCYTFRNWKHSLFGLLLVVLAAWWESIGLQLAVVYDLPLLAWIPIPVWLIGLYLAFGHLLLARLEWEQVRYAVTDRRLLLRRGVRGDKWFSMPLDQVAYFCLQPHGEQLGSVLVISRDRQRLKLCCIEHPRMLTDLLEQAMRDSGVLCDGDN
ncbi:hypothetical protein C2E25_04610 [Geothermobacter hydrogeniphilus]|uniref:YdbS-like PH domain-containing protein n=1 Tax=Geothermobacter hydrogeniphilus TaxID=1969733 RepID=A0A2K2HC77_9BACT|nr:PH domain-containing protein [Geothermobacter hydrogeniphilus]PNU20877.1 hypothetical protein C2E25_04610 [Geothermobacter hydrogeniphilus]